MILFDMEVPQDRATYHIDTYGRVRWYNCGRYPTYSFAARTEKLHEANVTFSLLFGGGARYSNGEDSLFLAECIRKGLKVYKAPVTIGKENGRPSTWFHGYNENFSMTEGFCIISCMAGPLCLWRCVFCISTRASCVRRCPFPGHFR